MSEINNTLPNVKAKLPSPREEETLPDAALGLDEPELELVLEEVEEGVAIIVDCMLVLVMVTCGPSVGTCTVGSGTETTGVPPVTLGTVGKVTAP